MIELNGRNIIELTKSKDSFLKFSKGIEDFIELSNERLRDVDIEKIKDKLIKIYENLKIMSRDGSPKFVAHSKIMHFLLPNLIPPMDKGNNIYFFYGKDRITKKGKKAKSVPIIKDEEKLFIDTLIEYQTIANKLNLQDQDLKNKWDTSIPKLIDNAIIGYNRIKPKNN